METDYLIVGAGPAGLQLAYFLDRAGLRYQLLERGPGAGTFFTRFPRHRQLISSNKIHTGYAEPERRMRFDWNSLLTEDHGLLFRDYSQKYFPPADDIVRYLGDFARKYVHHARYGVEVKRVRREGAFLVETAAGETFRARRLVVATGLFKPMLPDLPGIELCERYDQVPVDPEQFVNQRVLILGKGNSAFETGDNLVATAAVIHLASPHPVKMAWNTHFPGHLRAVNNNLLDTYQLKTQNALLDATVKRIERTPAQKLKVHFAYSHAQGETEEIEYDRVIACTGFRFDAEIFDPACRPELAHLGKLPAQTSAWESVNVQDLFFAGALTQMRDFKKTNSAFIHGFRYNSRALFHLLRARYEGVELPSRPVAAQPAALGEAILGVINSSSALWQQFGFMGDAFVSARDGSGYRHHEALPVSYLLESELGKAEDLFLVTLEFGHHPPDVFAVDREPVPEKADRSTFLHPVIRRYARGREIASLHLLENLFGEWTSPELHLQPLQGFLQAQLAQGPARMAATA